MLELDPTTWIKSAVIVRRNLGRNFIAHLASFSSVGAVKFTTIYDCMLRLQQCMKFKDKLALTEYNLPWRESYMDTEADQLLASSPSSLGSTSSSNSSTNDVDKSPVAAPSTSTPATSRMMSLTNVSPHSRGMKLVSMSTMSRKHDITLSPVPENKRLKLSETTSPVSPILIGDSDNST